MPYLGNTTTSFNVDSNNINNGSITTEKIAAGAVVNADVNDSASIAGTKISADFGAQDLIVDTNLLFVDVSTDRVGIGTSSVGYKLHVKQAGQTFPGGLAIERSDNTDKFNLAIDSNTKLNFGYNDSTKMVLTSGGSLGVGTTSPTQLLHVAGNIRYTGDLYAPDGSSTNASIRFHDSNSGLYHAGSDALGLITQGTEKARIDSSGRLLVGTTSSTASTAGDDLQIAGSSDRGLTITSGSTSSANIFLGDDGDPDRGRIAYQNNDDALDFSTNGGGTDVRIDSAGRLLVGRTTQLQSSSERFTVDGGISVMRFSSASNGTLHVRNEDSTASTNQPYIVLTDGSGNRGGIGVVNDSSAMWICGQTGIRFRGGSSSPGNTEFGRFDSDGLKFNGDTAAVNALNDYDEGTWTPSLSFSGGVTSITYNYQKGRYLRVGNLVHYYGYLSVNTVSGASGQVRITGFPIATRNATAVYHAPALGWYVGLATTSYGLGFDVAPNSVTHTITRGNGTGISGLTAGDINSTNFSIEWSFTIDAG